jgi:hypothetical protein
MMEALDSRKTSFLTRAPRPNVLEDSIPHSHRREDLKSYLAWTGWAPYLICNVFPVRYELSFYIPENGTRDSHGRENLKIYIRLSLCCAQNNWRQVTRVVKIFLFCVTLTINLLPCSPELLMKMGLSFIYSDGCVLKYCGRRICVALSALHPNELPLQPTVSAHRLGCSWVLHLLSQRQREVSFTTQPNTVPWSYKQRLPPKRRYTYTSLHDILLEKTCVIICDVCSSCDYAVNVCACILKEYHE